MALLEPELYLQPQKPGEPEELIYLELPFAQLNVIYLPAGQAGVLFNLPERYVLLLPFGMNGPAN